MSEIRSLMRREFLEVIHFTLYFKYRNNLGSSVNCHFTLLLNFLGLKLRSPDDQSSHLYIRDIVPQLDCSYFQGDRVPDF